MIWHTSNFFLDRCINNTILGNAFNKTNWIYREMDFSDNAYQTSNKSKTDLFHCKEHEQIRHDSSDPFQQRKKRQGRKEATAAPDPFPQKNRTNMQSRKQIFIHTRERQERKNPQYGLSLSPNYDVTKHIHPSRRSEALQIWDIYKDTDQTK